MTQPQATRIVATLGPATDGDAVLLRLVRAGVNVFRFNMSHGTHETHSAMMARARAAAARVGKPVGILVDLQGPKARTAGNEGGGFVPMPRGSEVRLLFTGGKPAPGMRSEPGRLVLALPDLSRELRPGDPVLFDDGRLAVTILGRAGRTLRAKVTRGGQLKEHAGVNLPGRVAALKVPTAKDRADAAFAVRQRADFVAISFVQSAEDVARVRRLLGPRPPLVIAKLEKPAALADLDRILEVADGVMVARGDLGVELSLEQVPLWQKEILRRARARGVFTITATEMLQSMVSSPVPTRAEVSDAANAILDGTDAVMLSAETASGRYPVEAVKVLARVASEADRPWLSRTAAEIGADATREGVGLDDPLDAITRAAVELAVRIGARRIAAFTMTGRTVRLLSRCRPPVPVLALTPSEQTRRRLTLHWNTRSLLLPVTHSVDDMMRRGIEIMREHREVRTGDMLVLTAGSAGMPAATNILRIVRVGE
jgi:pyruvate kinase